MYLIVQINSIRNKTIFFFTIPILQSLLSFSQFRISKLIRKKDYLPTGRAKKEKKVDPPKDLRGGAIRRIKSAREDK